ncbi:hypothetical protein [Tahibacter caeni]|uniref:hypothetical protein n=1 Tax=Tahibacter caeni TaxID=1453545 RepID=UPI0021489A5A|nr:hypothetical protein [Tahibacter caeni]
MHEPLSPSLETELRRLTARALSPASRYGHVALLLAGSIVSVLLAGLLATEPALPPRTQAAFGAMLAMAVGWIVYAAWVLRQRRPLMARHRVVAGWMAVAFTGTFTGGALAMAPARPQGIYTTAVVSGGGMLVLAGVQLIQAYRRRAELQARRKELEQLLGAAV